MNKISGIYLLFMSLLTVSCMPEEDLPVRDVGATPEYFIECYCKPQHQFSLSATTVLPVSENLQVDFSKEMSVIIHTYKDIELLHNLFTIPGSDFIYNYGSFEHFDPIGLDSLFLQIRTSTGKQITASTSIPSAVSIYEIRQKENETTVYFYTSPLSEENYYICSAEIIRNDSVIDKGTTYLDYSDYNSMTLIEKTFSLPLAGQAEKIICNLKRITKANYDYQISLNAANTANQSSITTPVPLKGNLNGALGIFTCYTEDEKTYE